MKKIISFLVFSLLVAFVIAPGINIVRASDDINSEYFPQGINDFKLIKDIDGNTVFQFTDDKGLTFEFHEQVKNINKTTKRVTIKKYLIEEKDKKKLVENKSISMTDNGSELILDNLTDKDAETVVINEEEIANFNNGVDQYQPDSQPLQYSPMAVKYQINSGGSYIADIRWVEYSDGSATAVNGTKYKNTRATNWNYRDFRAAANSIKTEERAIVTMGIAGIVDAVWAAVKKGDLLSWTLIKTVFKKFAKAVPGAGTIYTIYTYVNLCITANNLFKKIP